MEARVVEGYTSNDQSQDLQVNLRTALYIQILHEGKKARTTLDGETFVDSFKLPEDLPLDLLDIENLVPRDEGIRRSIAERYRKFSIVERLKGWKMKCTKRETGNRSDTLYTHKNFVKFRSAVEVVNFIFYEAYPSDRPRKRKAEANGEDLTVDDEDLFEGIELLDGKDFDLPEI